MRYLKKPEGRYDFSAVERELEGADAALETADAEIDNADKRGARRALMKAVEHLNAAVELSVQLDFGKEADGVLARLYYCRGHAAALLNKLERGSVNMTRAIADLVKSAELKPNARTYLRLGEVYALADNLDAALDSFEKAIRLDFNCAEAHILAKLIREKRGETEDPYEDIGEPIVF